MKPSPSKILAIFPSAGYGKRLGEPVPKIFVEVDGKKNIFELLTDSVKPSATDCVIVLSPEGANYVMESPSEKRRFIQSRAKIAIQPSAKGTADAVFSSLEEWENYDSILVIWGDQAFVSAETVRKTIQQHRAHSAPHLTFPILQVNDPYIHYEIDERRQQILEVKMQREGDEMPSVGTSDVGIFCLSVSGLLAAWQLFQQANILGKNTQEFNFPSFFTYLSAHLNWPISTVRVTDLLECRGINTKKDLEFARQFYSQRKAG